MSSDVDALQDKVSPAAIVERRKQATRTGCPRSRTGSWVRPERPAARCPPQRRRPRARCPTASDAASDAQQRFEGSPLAAGLVAFGAGVVLASLLPASRAEAEAAHRVVETAKEHGQPMLDEIRGAGQDVADTLKDSATQAAQQMKDSAQESTQKIKDEGAASAQSVRDDATS